MDMIIHRSGGISNPLGGQPAIVAQPLVQTRAQRIGETCGRRVRVGAARVITSMPSKKVECWHSSPRRCAIRRTPSVDEVLRATRALESGGKKKAPRSDSESAVVVVTAFRGVKSLAKVGVTVRDGKLRLTDIPLFAVADLVRALRGLQLPADGAAKPRAIMAPRRASHGTKRRR